MGLKKLSTKKSGKAKAAPTTRPSVPLPEGVNIAQKRIGLGIVLENSSIVVLQADISSKGIVVTAADEESIPQGSVSDGRVKNFLAIVESYQRISSRAKLSANAASINLPSHLSIIKEFDVPTGYFSGDDDKIVWEMEQHLTDPVFNYRFSATTAGSGERGEKTLIVGARKDPVDERVRLLTNMGLIAYAVEPNILALHNGLAVAFGDLPGKLILIVDIAESYSSFALIVDNVLMPGGVFYTPGGLANGHPGAISEFAQDMKTSFNTFYAIEGYSITGRKPDLLVAVGSLANSEIVERLGSELKIKPFDRTPFGGATVSSKVKDVVVPWQKLIKALGLAMRYPSG